MTESFSQVNRRALLQRVDGDLELLKELVEIFFSTYKANIDNLKDLLESKDFLALEQAAHSFKGTLQTFFNGKLIEGIYKIELSAREQDLESSRSALAEFIQIVALSSETLNDLHQYIE